ncbi:hypothetical protein PRK78_007399 [Emydomyces testavorans]|uniref:Uncharacterized protein n=1 Tax=Emydomyces testavorans TaxID=2070801 RepID=A0AAF0IMM8_9EURO|nr:hypothetical protein PRK78_007399 [Emydomyces testavorans]
MSSFEELGRLLQGHGLDNQAAFEDLWRFVTNLTEARIPARSQPQSSRGHANDQPAAQRPEPFTPGHTLRFTPKYARIRVDPSKGWDFSGPSAPAPPLRPCALKMPPFKVGISIDGWLPFRSKSAAGIFNQVENANEPVYLHLSSEVPGFELRDSFDRVILDKYVRFDPPYNNKNALLEAAQIRHTHELNANTQNWDAYVLAMRKWRIEHRIWEMNVLTREFESGNLAIFPPGITREEIQDALRHLQEENEQDAAGHIPAGYIGRPDPITVTFFSVPRHLSRQVHGIYEAFDTFAPEGNDS